MSTPCLDKAVHACDTHNRKARTGLKPYKHGTTHKQLSKYCLSLFSVGGIRCRGIETLSNLPPHFEQMDIFALQSWLLSRFCGGLRE